MKHSLTYLTTLLHQAARSRDLAGGKWVHSHLSACHSDVQDTFLGNLLVQLYGNCGKLEDARRVFDAIQCRNIFSWNIMAAAYAQGDDVGTARSFFLRMPQRDVVSFNSTLVANARRGDLHGTKAIFVSMPERNVVSWTTMVTASSENERLDSAKWFFDRMPRWNEVSWVAILSAYASTGDSEPVSGLKSLFDSVPHTTALPWNALLSACARCGEDRKVLGFFSLMDLEGVRPDSHTLTSAFNACASLTALTEGRLIHAEAEACHLKLDVQAKTAMLNMYAKCGSMNEAKLVFEGTLQRDVVTWNAAFAAYAQAENLSAPTLQLFQRMVQDGVPPSSSTFISLLSMCGDAGLAPWKIIYSDFLLGDYGVTPGIDHFVCLVDSLGRAGLLDEAEQLIQSMPFEPDVAVWRSFLAACTLHKDTGRGRAAADRIFEMEDSSGSYVQLSNIYRSSCIQDGGSSVPKTWF